MSTQGPQDPTSPDGEGHTSQFEYLPEEESARPARTRGRKRALAGVGVVALLALGGAGTYGLMQFMSSGDSAASAVPDHALGYLSLDLDPSGGQKLAAYETMRKFPALREQLGLRDDDDPRTWVVDAINEELPEQCRLDFEDEVEPWVGDKVAFSGVETDEGPQPFFVLEVSDSAAAEETVDKLFTCDDEEEYGTATVGDFMVVAPDAELAEDIAADAEESSLADDDNFNDRLADAGDQGVVTGYLAPGAVELMLTEAEEMESQLESSGSVSAEPSPGAMPEGELSFDDEGDLAGDDPVSGPMTGGMVPRVGPQIDLVRDYLEDFEGMAMHVRFADEGVEMELAAAGIDSLEDLEPGTTGMGDLPDSTAIAYGLGVGPEAVEMMEESIKGQMSDAEFEREVQRFEDETGLSFPEDVQTLLGDGLSLAVDGSIDFEALGEAFFAGRSQGLDVPVGLRVVNDDTDAVVEVTDKLQAMIPPGMPFSMEVAEGDGAVAVGVDADYVDELAGDGGLGDTDAFQDAVPDVDDSLGGLFIDFDAESWLDELVGSEDPEAAANVEPLSSLGMSVSVDGDDSGSMLLRLTTD